jgi:outer membrane receptor protein involved in Fe transport
MDADHEAAGPRGLLAKPTRSRGISSAPSAVERRAGALRKPIAGWLTCLVLDALLSGRAHAELNQTPAAPSPQPSQQNAPAAQGQPITVTGRRSETESSIDRMSYSIANDLQGATGSMADVLRNVPSVEVDPEGNVSIRGDPNVVILIDGQPSGQLRGAGRGAALQQLPAGQYERVEVMTNPSAAYGAEGTGGVINLIPKRVRQSGFSGAARANVGTRGRANGGISAAYNSGGTTLSGDLAARHDELSGSSDRERQQLDRRNGQFFSVRQRSDSVTETNSGSLKARVEHSLGRKTRLSAEAARGRTRSGTDALESYETDRLLLANTTPLSRNARSTLKLDNTEVRARLSREFDSKDHRLTVDASRQSSGIDRTIASNILFEDRSDAREEFSFSIDQDLTQLKADYARPLANGSKLQLGYEFEQQDNRYDNAGARASGEQALAPLPSFTNVFHHDQRVHALYGTLERPIGNLTALAGLRLEQVRLQLDQVTGQVRSSSVYFRAYPTLHLSYKLDDKEQLRASYSRRVQRPQGQDLNPFREYRDPLSLRAGNPRLQPQETDTLELAWQRRAGPNFYQAAAYYRRTRKAFTDVAEELDGGILLTTRQNLGASRALGLELVANRRLAPTLTFNGSSNISWNEIESRNLGFLEERSGVQAGGRASLNWQPSPKDHVQISGFLTGKILRPQGYRAPSGMINLGYRHKFDDRLSFVATVRDLLGNFGETVVYQTPRLRDRVEREFGGRVVFVGLTYTVSAGQRERRDPNFDYEAGPSN